MSGRISLNFNPNFLEDAPIPADVVAERVQEVTQAESTLNQSPISAIAQRVVAGEVLRD